ncbi:DNA helicase UvrD [Arthrobacter sp. Soil782]|uniref:ATP-dependent helicase n=1 Tax=Arthrobacter sp. Soil782 TaxID=1736410 RepID=UPI0006F54172|nr:ATP-dependent DNA helicase [Arthrobacter sp. Soil782]KRF04231.1 DNA helicase UvrD [Arthrobacter sp. Soil782]
MSPEAAHLRATDTVSADTASMYSAEALAQLLAGGTSADILYPTGEQTRIIEAPLQPLLVIAGAGSGKTKTMADRVVWLVANGLVRPDQILGVTFTRKAAGELAARIRQQLQALYRAQGESTLESGEDRLEPTISTYHSYANGIVQDYGLRLGVERDAVMLGTAQSWQLAGRIVESYRGPWEHLSAARTTLTGAVLTMASECAEHLVDPAAVRISLLEQIDSVAARPYLLGKPKPSTQGARDLLNRLRTRVTVTELVEQYAAAKSQGGQLDYGDLVSLAARIVSEVPQAVDAERQKYAVILLDEFQDTSHAQMVLFARLFGDGRSVTAVGDPHQSIYGFRGASAGQLGTFRSRFPVHTGARLEPAPMVNLSVAWRNSTSILAAANAVAEPLNVPPPWLGPQHQLKVPALLARPKAPLGEVYLARYRSESAAAPQDPSAPDNPQANEAAALSRIIQEQRRRYFDLDDDGRPLRPTIAVLCRGRRQFEPLRQELQSLGIPVQVIGLGGLLRTPEIIEILSVLRVLGDPERSDAMLRLLAGARWRLGSADLMALGDWARQLAYDRELRISQLRVGTGKPDAQEGTAHQGNTRDSAVSEPEQLPTPTEDAEPASLVDAVDHLPPVGWVSGSGRTFSETGRERLVRLRDELRGLRQSVGDDLHSLIGEIEQTLLLDIELAAKPGVSVHEARRNLDAFADAVSGFVSTSDRIDVQAFLAWLEAADSEEDGLPVTALETSREAVQLLTVHAAKGLEWDVVLVPGMNEGSFPSGTGSRWSSGDASVPWPLRGDAAELPQWDWDQPDQKSWLDSEKLFAEDALTHTEREERRLAYVALTRARHVLVCSSSAWGGGRSKPTTPSRYLERLRELAAAGEPGYRELAWIEDGAVGADNPARAHSDRAIWPIDPLRRRRGGMEQAAAAVRAAADDLRHGSGPEPGTEDIDLPGRWSDEVRKSLARQQSRLTSVPVELPTHISASLMVELTEDSDGVARRLRRPVPRRPGTAARRGTAFHAWIEEFYGTTGMLDLGEFPGAADSFVDDGLQLEQLAETFRKSAWAQRVPYGIEVPVETRVGSVVVRGRIDAVFQDDDGTWDLLDWKTGRPPAPADREAKAIQLAIYRLAWSRLKNVPLAGVRAAFYYAAEDQLVRPHDLASSETLEAIVRKATSAGSGG